MKRNLHPSVSLVLPCFNEDAVFEESVHNIFAVLSTMAFPYEVIFVDDKSTDNTREKIRKIVTKYRFCSVIFHTKNLGRGRSVMDGIKAAKGRVVGFIDIDCEVSPVYIPFLSHAILSGNADVVVGKRLYRTSVLSVIREVLSRGYQRIANIFLSTHGIDTESGYKFFSRARILPIIKECKNEGWFWDTEVIVRSLRADLRVMEFPVLFIRRFDKISSVHIFRDTIEYMVQLWRFRRELKKE